MESIKEYKFKVTILQSAPTDPHGCVDEGWPAHDLGMKVIYWAGV